MFGNESKGKVYLKQSVFEITSPVEGFVQYGQNGVNIKSEKEHYFVPYVNILLIDVEEEPERRF